MNIYFERVVLENWLVYRGRVNIDFGSLSTDNKNIIVIHGLNGFGKTSLLRGIRWAFHQYLPEKSLHECFNTGAIRAGDRDLSVEVHFLVDGIPYQLIRRAKARLDGAGEAIAALEQPPELIIDGRALEGAVQDAIEQLLPRECQQFFFFDGLEIETYASKQRPSEIREAIERVLGIPEVRNLRTDLGRVRERWEEDRDRLLGKEEEHHSLVDELKDLRIEEEGLQSGLEGEREKRNALKQLVNELDKRASALEGIQAERERLQTLERLRDLRERTITEKEEQLDSAMHNAARHLLLPLLQKQAARLQTEAGTRGYREVQTAELQARKKIFEEILESMRCVCEREVTTNVAATFENQVKDIDEALARARQTVRSGGAEGFAVRQNALARIIGTLEAEPIDVTKAFQLKQKLELEIQEITQEIAALEEKLSEYGESEVREVYQLRGEKRKELEYTNTRIGEKEKRLREVGEKIERKNREVNHLALENKELAALTQALNLAVQSEKAAKALVDELLDERRKTIVDNINRVFRNVTNKPQEYDRVKLMEDWGVCVVTKNDTIVSDDALSAGEKEVLAFSFIAGLNLSTERAAPLLMDTPFGHLDNRHRRGLLEALPTLPNQVILLATDRDLPDDDMPRLQSHLHRHLELVRDQQAEMSNIQEVG